jgi:hypothetical protein
MVRFGVVVAVCEFCVEYNWKILNITVENKNTSKFCNQYDKIIYGKKMIINFLLLKKTESSIRKICF